MKTAQARNTIFCAGNEKLLYPPTPGRRRVAKSIFDTNGFDLGKSNPAEIKVTEEKTQTFARRNEQSFQVDAPIGLAKGAHSRDFMNQSMDSNTYGVFSSKKRLEDKNNLRTQYSDADFSALKYRDPLKKDRINKYMDSTGMKKSLASSDQISVPSTPRKQNIWMNSSGMRDAMSSPTNGNYKCLNVTGKP